MYRALGDYPDPVGEAPDFDAEPDESWPDPDNGGWARNTDLALKVAVTNLMGELLRMKLRARGVTVPA